MYGKFITRPVTRQDSSPDIAHFVSGKFYVRDLDFDMTCVCVCLCVYVCWRERWNALRKIFIIRSNEILKQEGHDGPVTLTWAT